MKRSDPSEFARGRKSAIEDLKRDIDAATHNITEDFGRAVVFQLDCSSTLNRTSRLESLRNIADKLPHLLVSVGHWLRVPMVHILKTEEGDPRVIETEDGLPQGCPSAPSSLFDGNGESRRRSLQGSRELTG